MLVDPVEALMTLVPVATSSLLVPTSTASPSVAPIPTVAPTPPHVEKVGDSGASALWVVFVIMLLSTVSFTVMAYRVPVQKRLFHVLTAFITLFATLSYFAMATGDGNSWAHIVVKVTHKHGLPTTHEDIYRQVFWARYVDWSLTTPLLLLDLSFLAGMNGSSIIVSVVADVVMCLTGLFAAFGAHDGQKWGWYAMGCIAYLVIVYQLVTSGRAAAKSKAGNTTTLFTSISLFTLVLWTLYPIVWGFGDGSRIMSVDQEIIAYAVLDVLAKPVFGFWLLFAHDNSTSIEGFWSQGLGGEGTIRIDDDEGA